MAFTRELRGNERHEILTRTLCASAVRSHVDICFEGVETEELAEYLKEYGNVLLQGYHFAKPLMPEEFIEKYCK
jgi:EAL domain-containing protein (putative c-di-GMP-specific phosphodiesterase class I)